MQKKSWFEQFINGIGALFAAAFALDFLSDVTGYSEEDIAFFGLMHSSENNQEDEEYDDQNDYEPPAYEDDYDYES